MTTCNVSVIIVTHNRQSQLVRLTRALLNNTKLPSQIIIIDNGTDHTFQKKIKALCFETKIDLVYQIVENLGVSHSRNLGINLITKEIFAFLDDDQIPCATWLANLNLRDFTKYVAIGGKRTPSLPNNYWHKIWEYTEKEFNPKTGNTKFIPTGNSFFFKPFLSSNNISFAEQLSRAAADDCYFCYEIVNAGGKIKYDAKIEVLDDFRSSFSLFVKQWFYYGLGTCKYHLLVYFGNNPLPKKPNRLFRIFLTYYKEATDIFRKRKRPLNLFFGLFIRDAAYFTGYLAYFIFESISQFYQQS